MALQDSVLHIQASLVFVLIVRWSCYLSLRRCPNPLRTGVGTLCILAPRHLHPRELVRQPLVLCLPCALLRLTSTSRVRRWCPVGRRTVRRLGLLVDARSRATRSRLLRVYLRHDVRRACFLHRRGSSEFSR